MQLYSCFKTCLVMTAVSGLAIIGAAPVYAGGGGGWGSPPPAPPAPAPAPAPAPTPQVGSSQSTPILPTVVQLLQQTGQVISAGRQWFTTARTVFSFFSAPRRSWIDPPTAAGFRFSMTPSSNSLFTEIVDFPTGIDPDNRFTVSVGGNVLGDFGPGQSVNFVSLLGSGVREFDVTGIDPLIDLEQPNPFPLQVDFNTEVADLTMTPLEAVPEPLTVLGTVTFGTFLGSAARRRRQKLAKGSQSNA